MSNSSFYDTIIIGAGPAGLTAAIYLLRAGKSVLLLEKSAVGGQIVYSPLVENFPGIKSVSGADFASTLFEQVESLGGVFCFSEVIHVSTSSDNGIKTVSTAENDIFTSKTLIISTGVKHKKLNLEKENLYSGKGISYCAICDGAFFKNQDVAVIGGGNTALSDAILLSSICAKVFLIHRRDSFRGELRSVSFLKSKSNVEFVLNSEIKEIQGENRLESLSVYNKITKTITSIPVKALFVAIGQTPENTVFSSLINHDADGYIITSNNCETSQPGIFAIGDCRQKDVRQLVTAASDGAIAATYINSVLF